MSSESSDLAGHEPAGSCSMEEKRGWGLRARVRVLQRHGPERERDRQTDIDVKELAPARVGVAVLTLKPGNSGRVSTLQPGEENSSF